MLIIVRNLSVPLDRRVWLECLALREAGYRVSVVCPRFSRDARFEERDGVRIYRYRSALRAHGALTYAYEYAYSWLRTALLLVRVLWADGISVIQTCNPPVTYWALALPYKLAGKRFVYDQHDLCPELFLSRFDRPSALQLRLLHLLERLNYRIADKVIVTNESYREVALTRGKLRAADVTVVRSGPNTDVMCGATTRWACRACTSRC